MENKINTKIKALRTDRGREYLSEQFKTFYDENGIARQLTIPYTPQQNGIAENEAVVREGSSSLWQRFFSRSTPFVSFF